MGDGGGAVDISPAGQGAQRQPGQCGGEHCRGQADLGAEPAPEEGAHHHREVEADLINRQRPRPHPGRGCHLRRALRDGGGGDPANAEQHHAHRRHQPMCGRRHQRHTDAADHPGEVDRVATAQPGAHLRQHQPGGHPAHPHQPEQHAVGAGVHAQLLAHDQRQHCPGRRAGEKEAGSAQDGRPHDRGMADEANASPHRPAEMLARQRRNPFAPVPAQQRDNHRQVADRIQPKRQRRPAGQHQHPRKRRTHGAGEVKADAVEGDGLHQIVPWHRLGHNRAPGRVVHRLAEADGEGKAQQQPRIGQAEIGQHCKPGGGQQHPADQRGRP